MKNQRFILYKKLKSSLEEIKDDSGNLIGYKIPNKNFLGNPDRFDSRVHRVEGNGLVLTLGGNPIKNYFSENRQNRLDALERAKAKVLEKGLEKLHYDNDKNVNSLVRNNYPIFHGDNHAFGVRIFPAGSFYF